MKIVLKFLEKFLKKKSPHLWVVLFSVKGWGLNVYPEIVVGNPEIFRIRKFDYEGGMYYHCCL